MNVLTLKISALMTYYNVLLNDKKLVLITANGTFTTLTLELKCVVIKVLTQYV